MQAWAQNEDRQPHGLHQQVRWGARMQNRLAEALREMTEEKAERKTKNGKDARQRSEESSEKARETASPLTTKDAEKSGENNNNSKARQEDPLLPKARRHSDMFESTPPVSVPCSADTQRESERGGATPTFHTATAHVLCTPR